MNALLFVFALGLGVVAAVPVGPVQIEAAKRAMAGHLRAGLMVVAGSFVSDAGYGAIAMFGIAPVIQKPALLAAFSGAGAVILWVLAYLTWRESRSPHALNLDESSLANHRWALVTGFLLGASNPPIILSWLFGATVAHRIGLSPFASVTSKGCFVAGGALGLAGYLTGMALVTMRMRHFFSTRVIARIYWWLAVVLLALSLYFVHGVWAYFTRLPAHG
jgi:threonine/homoserine/homoserine lactone efflux protein